MSAIGLTLAAMIPQLIQSGIGISQLIKGNQLGNVERPVMGISDSDKEATNISRMLAASGNMPGYNLAKENIDTTFSGAIQQGLAGGNPNVSQLYNNKTFALKGLAESNSGFQTDQLSRLTSSLRTMGGLERETFDYNQNQPYQETVAAANRLKEGGTQNLFNALGSISGGLIDANSTNQILEMIKGEGEEVGIGGLSSLKSTLPTLDAGYKAGDSGNYAQLFAAIEKNPELLKFFEKYLPK